jgi:tetratricopeptide (TPR) repeat protein
MMEYRFARPCIILLCFALMVCQSKASVQDDLTVARDLRDRGDFKEAIAVLKRIVMAPSTSTTPAEIKATWNMLGSAYLATGNYSEARRSIEQALQIAKAAAPENLTEEAAALDQLGLVYLEVDDNSREFKVRDQALRIYEQLGDNAGIFAERNSQANLAIKTMKLKQAHEFLDEAFAQVPLARTISTADMAILYSNVGWLAYTENKPDAAFDAYQKALQFWIRAYGVHDYKVGETYIQLGKVYLQHSDVNDADSNIRKGMAILKQALGDNNPITLSAMVAYSRLLDVQGQHEQAAQLEASAERSLHGRFGTAPCTACDLYGRYPRS